MNAIISRRSGILAGGALLTSAVPPDAELAALAGRVEVLERMQAQITAEMRLHPFGTRRASELEDETDALVDEEVALLERMSALRAATPAGRRAQARAALAAWPKDPEGRLQAHGIYQRQIAALVCDVAGSWLGLAP